MVSSISWIILKELSGLAVRTGEVVCVKSKGHQRSVFASGWPVDQIVPASVEQGSWKNLNDEYVYEACSI